MTNGRRTPIEVDGRARAATMRAMKERTHSGLLLSRRFHLVLLHLAEEARRDLDRLRTRQKRAIHSLRTRMKNLRALLLLVKPRIPKPERKTVAKLAGKLKDAFSEQRDAHVIAALLTKFPGLRESTTKKKVAPETAGTDRTAKTDASRLIRMVSKLRLHGLTWREVIDEYLTCYRAGRKAMKVCKREQSAEAFHEWRRPVKEMFYQSQALQPLDGMKHRRSAAERLGDRLGELNDLQMLHAKAKKSGSPDALKQIGKKQRSLKPSIFKAGGKLYGERPSAIAHALERCVKFHPSIAAQAVRQT